MADNLENLTLEHLCAIRAEMARMADYMQTMQAEMMAMRQSLAGVTTLQDHGHGDIAALKVPVERVERRLDLVD